MKQQLIDAGLAGDAERFNKIADAVLAKPGSVTNKAAVLLDKVQGDDALLLAAMEMALYWRAEQLRKRGGAETWSSRGHNETDEVTTCPGPRPIPKPEAVPAGAGVVVSIFDALQIRGRAIGEIRIRDIDGIVATNAYETDLLRSIKQHAGGADPNATVRDVVSPNKLRFFVKQAEELRPKTK